MRGPNFLISIAPQNGLRVRNDFQPVVSLHELECGGPDGYGVRDLDKGLRLGCRRNMWLKLVQFDGVAGLQEAQCRL